MNYSNPAKKLQAAYATNNLINLAILAISDTAPQSKLKDQPAAGEDAYTAGLALKIETWMRHWAYSSGGKIWCSNEHIAKQMSCNVDNVKKALKLLRRYGTYRADHGPYPDNLRVKYWVIGDVDLSSPAAASRLHTPVPKRILYDKSLSIREFVLICALHKRYEATRKEKLASGEMISDLRGRDYLPGLGQVMPRKYLSVSGIGRQFGWSRRWLAKAIPRISTYYRDGRLHKPAEMKIDYDEGDEPPPDPRELEPAMMH